MLHNKLGGDMIRKLNEEDRNIVLEYLYEEASINLFMIGDIEAFGFDKDFQELWGQFDSKNELEGVLLRFNENYIPYFKNDEFDIADFKAMILNAKEEKMISGKESVVDKFRDTLPNGKARVTYFCELIDNKKLSTENENIKIADINDSERIYDFIECIEEFNAAGNSIERISHKIETKTGRIYYIENDKGEIISVSQTTAENSKSAMVVAVATKQEYRGLGYVTRGLSKLCSDVLNEGKTLCLFYDNPKAGTVYHKLGFHMIDNWMMITEEGQ